MPRLKKMPVSIIKDLERAGNKIANKLECCICSAIPGSDWEDTEEAKMIDPGVIYWWGLYTMNYLQWQEPCRSARLMGIAIMITMPECIINHECSPETTKNI